MSCTCCFGHPVHQPDGHGGLVEVPCPVCQGIPDHVPVIIDQKGQIAHNSGLVVGARSSGAGLRRGSSSALAATPGDFDSTAHWVKGIVDKGIFIVDNNGNIVHNSGVIVHNFHDSPELVTSGALDRQWQTDNDFALKCLVLAGQRRKAVTA